MLDDDPVKMDSTYEWVHTQDGAGAEFEGMFEGHWGGNIRAVIFERLRCLKWGGDVVRQEGVCARSDCARSALDQVQVRFGPNPVHYFSGGPEPRTGLLVRFGLNAEL